MNNGHTYQTVLIGRNLEEINERLNDLLSQQVDFPLFVLKDNKNVHFTVIHANVSVIEFELLSAEDVIDFHELAKLSQEDLTQVLSQVANDFIIGIALLHSEDSFIKRIYSCLPEHRKQMIANIIKLELGKIKMNDVLQAQNDILRVVEQLYEKREISLDFKDQQS